MRRKAYLIIGLTLLAAAIAQAVRLPAPRIVFLNLIPAEVFLAGQALWWRRERSKAFHAAVITLGAVAFAFALFVNVAAEMFLRETETITDVRQYAEIKARWPAESVGHFPETIPPKVKARFSYQPAFLQGGAHIQLRLTLSPQEAQALYDRFSALARFRFQGGDWSQHANAPGGVPTTHFHTSDDGSSGFPSSYEVLVLGPFTVEEAEQRRKEGYAWNHGESHGVAIDRTGGEVVYWAERW